MADMIYPGNATPANVLSGQTFSAGTNYNTAGTMPNNGQVIITPSATQQTIPQGYHDGTGYVQAGTLGASGTATAASSTATFTNASGVTASLGYITVTGLNFTPKRIIVHSATNGSGQVASTIVDTDFLFNSGGSACNILYNSASSYQLTGNAYVNGTGFQIPVNGTGASWNWYAYK